MKRNKVWLIPLILIITYPLWSIPVGSFLAPPKRVDTQPKTEQVTKNPSFTMETVKIVQSQKGERTALIRAKSARLEKRTDTFILEMVDADIFDKDGNITHIVSKTGAYNNGTQILTLIDDVVVNKTHDQQFLYTDLLHYNSNKRTVNCPGKTRLVGKNVTVNGGSLDYDVATARYDIGKRVYVVLGGFTSPGNTPAP